jgi:hypothetical protein
MGMTDQSNNKTPSFGVCKTCSYWDPTIGLKTRSKRSQADNRVPDNRRSIGKCRRYAPRASLEFSLGQWPSTNDDDWCGEHNDFAAWRAWSNGLVLDPTLAGDGND